MASRMMPSATKLRYFGYSNYSSCHPLTTNSRRSLGRFSETAVGFLSSLPNHAAIDSTNLLRPFTPAPSGAAVVKVLAPTMTPMCRPVLYPTTVMMRRWMWTSATTVTVTTATTARMINLATISPFTTLSARNFHSITRNINVSGLASGIVSSSLLSKVIHHQNRPPATTMVITDIIATSRRYYTPLSKDEEEQEKQRVAALTPFQKDQELRQYNRQIARLEKLRGINTGELYTWSGSYKALARDYGMPMVLYYGAVWATTAVLCYASMTVFNLDAMYIIAQIDAKTGWDITSQVNPEYGKIGIVLIINELIEPIRLPIVILTVKPVIDKIFPPKY